jgi:putative membrane protein
MDKTLHSVLLSILFAAVGFALLFAGYRLFDRLTPTNLSSDIFENGNVAAAVLAGAFVIALAIVIHAALS